MSNYNKYTRDLEGFIVGQLFEWEHFKGAVLDLPATDKLGTVRKSSWGSLFILKGPLELYAKSIHDFDTVRFGHGAGAHYSYHNGNESIVVPMPQKMIAFQDALIQLS